MRMSLFQEAQICAEKTFLGDQKGHEVEPASVLSLGNSVVTHNYQMFRQGNSRLAANICNLLDQVDYDFAKQICSSVNVLIQKVQIGCVAVCDSSIASNMGATDSIQKTWLFSPSIMGIAILLLVMPSMMIVKIFWRSLLHILQLQYKVLSQYCLRRCWRQTHASRNFSAKLHLQLRIACSRS